MNSLIKEIVRSICAHDNCHNFPITISDMFDNEFDLHQDESKGYVLDPDLEPNQCHMIERETGVIVKLTANTFFGTTLEVIEDPNNILGEDWEVENCPHLYDSLSYLNIKGDKDA